LVRSRAKHNGQKKPTERFAKKGEEIYGGGMLEKNLPESKIFGTNLHSQPYESRIGEKKTKKRITVSDSGGSSEGGITEKPWPSLQSVVGMSRQNEKQSNQKVPARKIEFIPNSPDGK